MRGGGREIVAKQEREGARVGSIDRSFYLSSSLCVCEAGGDDGKGCSGRMIGVTLEFGHTIKFGSVF